MKDNQTTNSFFINIFTTQETLRDTLCVIHMTRNTEKKIDKSITQETPKLIDLRQEVYVFAGVYLFACLFVCLSVCNITQKVMDQF